MGQRGFVNDKLIQVSTVLILLISEAAGYHRDLLGAEVVFGEDELANFKLPERAELLLQSESNCPYPGPPNIQAKAAVICGTAIRTRKCLNVSDTEPVLSTRNCTMDYCVGKNTYPETICFLESFGISIDIDNKTRHETCGLDPSDKIWLKPAINPAALQGGGNNSCATAAPPGVVPHVWVECVKGRPEYRFRLHFVDRAMPRDKPFSCLVSPACLNGRLKARMVCYAENELDVEDVAVVLNDESSKGARSIGRRASPGALWVVVLVMISCVRFC